MALLALCWASAMLALLLAGKSLAKCDVDVCASALARCSIQAECSCIRDGGNKTTRGSKSTVRHCLIDCIRCLNTEWTKCCQCYDSPLLRCRMDAGKDLKNLTTRLIRTTHGGFSKENRLAERPLKLFVATAAASLSVQNLKRMNLKIYNNGTNSALRQLLQLANGE